MERAEGLERLVARLGRAYSDGVAARRTRLAALWQLAGAVSYRGVLGAASPWFTTKPAARCAAPWKRARASG